MDKKEIYEAADKCIENNYSKYDILDHSDIQQFFIFGAEWALSLPKEVEPKKEVDLGNLYRKFLKDNKLVTKWNEHVKNANTKQGLIEEIDLDDLREEFKNRFVWNGTSKLIFEFLTERLPIQKPVESEWISVEDRLPTNSIQEVICVRKTKDGGNSYSVPLTWRDGKFQFFLETYVTIPDVTHWMPLPQPPKTNSNN